MNDELEVQDVTEEPEAVEAEAEAEELIVTLGDEVQDEEAEAEGDEPQEGVEQDTKVIRMLRRKADEAVKAKAELRDAKRKLAELEAAKAPAKVELPKEPDLADFDYDTAKFKAAHREWIALEAKVKDQEATARAANEAAEREWKGKLDGYAEAKKTLRVQGFDEAEADAREILSQTQQAIILQGAENPALMVYALGKNPVEAKKLAAIKDPVQFAFAVAKMEATKLKATPRKPSAAPEQSVKGSGQPPSASTASIEKLREQATRTGDFRAYHAAKRKLAG